MKSEPTNDDKKISGYSSDFGERLSWIIAQIGNLKKAGAVANIKPEMVGKWRDGDTKPPLFAAAKLCAAAGVSVDWLLNGEEGGDSKLNKADARSLPEDELHIDREFFINVIQLFETRLLEEGVSLSPEKKALVAFSLLKMIKRFPEFYADGKIDEALFNDYISIVK